MDPNEQYGWRDESARSRIGDIGKQLAAATATMAIPDTDTETETGEEARSVTLDAD